MKYPVLRVALGLMTFCGWMKPSFGIPQNTRFFCEHYTTSPLCVKQATVCKTCHVEAPTLNPFGLDLKSELLKFPDYDKKVESFRRYLGTVAALIEPSDSDGDGVSNAIEIEVGTGPGDAKVKPGNGEQLSFDAELAMRRTSLLFCGSSPSMEVLQELKTVQDPIIKKQLRRQVLDRCLTSNYWLKTALPRLADDKIRPNTAIGPNGDPFIIGDYYYDYRLFTYVLSENRDARDLLQADYHIDAKGQRIEGTIPSYSVPGKSVLGNGQPLQVDRRYGMITSQWFIALNTMFAEIPRNTAAQAYRSYLGVDIAKSEGLFPIANEPSDFDKKGVAQAQCAFCHSTLDPLAYAFTPYAGLNRREPVGSYSAANTKYENKGAIFGERVANLDEWTRVAVGSDAFKQNLALMFFRFAIGHAPETSQERADYAQLWRSLPDDDYSADQLIRRLVETLSFAGRTADVLR